MLKMALKKKEKSMKKFGRYLVYSIIQIFINNSM